MEYLSEGLSESIINTLSQIPNLRVIPRTTAFRFKGCEDRLDAVARDLNVRAVVTGKVVQRGDILIIQTELIDVTNDAQLWGGHYSRKLSDIFTIQEEIASDISEKLRIRLSAAEKRVLVKRYTSDDEAYRLYLKGRYHWEKWTADGWKRGLEYFRQAIEKDPAFALPYSGMADSYHYLGWYGIVPPGDAYSKVRAAATKALEIDETLAEAHASLGCARLWYDWDWGAAEKEFRRAIELNPNYANVHNFYSNFLLAMGRLEEALREAERCRQLGPLSPNAVQVVPWILYHSRRYEEAFAHLEQVFGLEPDFGPAHLQMSVLCVAKKMYGEALAHNKKAIETLKEIPATLGPLGYIYAVSGRKDEALEVNEKLKRLSSQSYVSPFEVALIHMGLGEMDQAFDWLEKAYQERSNWLVYLGVWPILDVLRDDARFQNLVRRVGLPP